MVFAQRGGFKNLVILCLMTDVLAVNNGLGRADLHARYEWLWTCFWWRRCEAVELYLYIYDGETTKDACGIFSKVKGKDPAFHWHNCIRLSGGAVVTALCVCRATQNRM